MTDIVALAIITALITAATVIVGFGIAIAEAIRIYDYQASHAVATVSETTR